VRTLPTDYLLIGAGGLVGAALRSALAGRSFTATAHERAVPGAVTIDVTDSAALRALIRAVRPRAIIVAAAAAWVERCEREPDATRAVNVTPVRIATEEAEALGATVVVFSSEYVFDGGLGRSYDESDLPAPLNEYGRQKVELERIAASREAHLICRTSGVFGPEGARKNFVLSLVDTLRTGRPYTVPSDQLITPTYAPALAESVLALLDRGASGTFHTSGPQVVNRFDFAREIADVFHLDAGLLQGRLTEELGLLTRRPLAAGLDASKLAGAVGPMPTARNGLLELLRREG